MALFSSKKVSHLEFYNLFSVLLLFLVKLGSEQKYFSSKNLEVANQKYTKKNVKSDVFVTILRRSKSRKLISSSQCN